MSGSTTMSPTPAPQSNDKSNDKRNSQIKGKGNNAHAARPDEIAIGVIIGRVGEFFDFFVYGIASALVFPGLFFPNASAEDALFYSFLIFSFGFIGRPIGAAIFRGVFNRYGHATKLTSALMLLGTTTVLIAFLPGYATLGETAIILLAVLRILQGIAVGGAWDGLPSLLAISSPPERRGWYAMIAQIGAPIGFIVAISLFAYLYWSIPSDEFMAWGWRFAFFTAFAINVVTLFARLRISVAPESEELFHNQELLPSPIGELFRERFGSIFRGALAPLASYALFHLVTIYPLAWVLLKPEQFSLDVLLKLQIVGGVLCLITMLISGAIADRIGREKMLGIGAAMIIAFTLPAPILGDTTFGAWAFILTGFSLLGFSLAQSAGALNSGFEPRYRYSGALVTHELGWLLGAAFAPLIALWLGINFGEGAVALYLLSGGLGTLLALWLNSKARRKIPG